MKNFKKLFVLLFLINIIALVGCDNVVETVVPTHSILGKWDVEGYFGSNTHFNFDFQTEGKLIVIEYYNNDNDFVTNVRYYEISPNNLFLFQGDKYTINWKSNNHLILRLIDNPGYFDLKR